MPIPNLTLITNAQLILPNGVIRRGTVIVEGSRIGDIVDTVPGSLLLNQDNVQVISGEGHYLSPGLIDLQVNGAYGVDFNSAGIKAINQVLGKLPERGITGVLLTAVSAQQADMLKTVNTLEEVIHHKHPAKTRPLGIHLEGPFLSTKYRGTHPLSAIDACRVEDILSLLSPHIRQVTLAPERNRALELIEQLVRRGVRVSAGHSNADTEHFLKGVSKGVAGVTHLYNAMRPFHHRDPGITGIALADPNLYVQLIADGFHAHPYALEMAIRSKPLEKLILASDMMQLAGMPEKSSVTFTGQSVSARNGCAVNAEGNLAGSCSFLDQCVRNLVAWDLASFSDAVVMASTHPAEYLGEGHQLGKLQRGYLADLVLWKEDDLSISATWVNGELSYQNQQNFTRQNTQEPSANNQPTGHRASNGFSQEQLAS
ncbi:MAG: N-acetylglucosamine-6-phosphate deacetylase [Vampirovibrionales bacterium]|nr:N-acetylglucosamine-6-phosphate deacetylase [Vampirovibrionales bacterium]